MVGNWSLVREQATVLLTAGCTALMVSAASVAQADPVTLTYRVDLTERCTYNDTGAAHPATTYACAASSESFLLTMTYDDVPTGTYVTTNCEQKTTYFGVPTFDVGGAFDLIDDPFGLAVEAHERLWTENAENTGQTNTKVWAESGARGSHTIADASGAVSRQWKNAVILSDQVLVRETNDLSVVYPTAQDLFGRLTGSLGLPLSFSAMGFALTYTCVKDAAGSCATNWSTEYDDRSLYLYGTATPVAVPEPVSLLLIGAGLSGILCGRRRLGSW